MGGSSGSGYYPKSASSDWCASDHTTELVNLVSYAASRALPMSTSGELKYIDAQGIYEVYFGQIKHGEIDQVVSKLLKKCSDDGANFSVELSDLVDVSRKVIVLLISN